MDVSISQDAKSENENIKLAHSAFWEDLVFKRKRENVLGLFKSVNNSHKESSSKLY